MIRKPRRNLVRKGKSRWLKVVGILLYTIISAGPVATTRAQTSLSEFFETNLAINYQIKETGIVEVENDFLIKNLTSEKYPQYFIFNITGSHPMLLTATQDGIPMSLESTIIENGISIKVYLNNDIVGRGKSQEFKISYSADNFTKKTGDNWEILIPKISEYDKFADIDVTVTIPNSFGIKSYMSPKPEHKSETNDVKNYYFKKDDITDNGISAGFGNFQVFAFTLNYHLSNDSGRNKTQEIAIPPDTSTQKLIYTSINPHPENVTVDSDGNWIASFELDKNSRIDVVAKGYAKIFATPETFIAPETKTLNDNLKATKYWQANENEIKKLAQQLKTPDNIYNYVVNNLTYNPDKATPNSQRLGALSALENKTDAICTEFTDVFIAIARAAGIPAREINGYAYTENPDVQPISLVADVLHAWPEYWASDRKVWVPVDPTWGSTSGINYFDNLDLRHFSFVIHGENDDRPYPAGSYKLGIYPQKDVFVAFGQIDKEYDAEFEINAQSNNYLFITRYVTANIKNTGAIALYDLNPKIYFDDKLSQSDFVKIIPPYGSYTKDYNISLNNLGKKSPEKIIFRLDDKDVSITTKKALLFVSQLLIILIFSILALTLSIKVYKMKKRKSVKKYELY